MRVQCIFSVSSLPAGRQGLRPSVAHPIFQLLPKTVSKKYNFSFLIMLVVIADDFSGAAEMAGIGHRYGLTTAIQLRVDPRLHAELLVIDTNSRSLDKAAAIRKMQDLADDLKKLHGPVRLFKKVDSVMRGHIAAEIDVLQQELGYDRVLLLPANPGRGRKIISGVYEINEITLEKTVFANDPDFPVISPAIEILLKRNDLHLPHIHITQNTSLPPASFITGDIESATDLKNYLEHTGEKDLCCGAAECFEAYLDNLGYTSRSNRLSASPQTKLPFTLIINGSTVKNQYEKELFSRLNIPQLSLPGEWQNDQFKLEEEDAGKWHIQVLELLHRHSIVAIAIDHPVNQSRGGQEIFSPYFVKLMHYISGKIARSTIHFCLTGGATASAIIGRTGMDSLKVKEETAPSIVTLTGDGEGLFTVKPGSYAWPQSFLENLSNQQSNTS
jgi:hypothetical protein